MKKLIAFLVPLFFCGVSNAFLSPYADTATATSVMAVDGSVSAPSISFANGPGSGLYRIGAHDVGYAVAQILALEMKKSTGAFVNIGMGGDASSADSTPFYLKRALTGAWTAIAENSNTGAGDGAKWQVKAGSSTFEFGLFALATTSPDAYNGGRGTLRCTDDCIGISAISDGAATGNFKFYMGGNAAGNFVMGVDQYGLRLPPNAAARPSCAVGIRGQIYFKPGGAGVADEIDMCTKDSGDAYSWVVVKAAS